MHIQVNGKLKEFSDSSNLKNIIDQFCKDNPRVIASVNGQIIKNQQWNQQFLNNGDHIELIHVVGGG